MSTSNLPTLLIVDDEPAIRLLLNEFLKKKFQIVTLNGGRECLRHIEHTPGPNVIIVDLNMPDLSGLEVIRKIRSNLSWNKD